MKIRPAFCLAMAVVLLLAACGSQFDSAKHTVYNLLHFASEIRPASFEEFNSGLIGHPTCGIGVFRVQIIM